MIWEENLEPGSSDQIHWSNQASSAVTSCVKAVNFSSLPTMCRRQEGKIVITLGKQFQLPKSGQSYKAIYKQFENYYCIMKKIQIIYIQTSGKHQQKTLQEWTTQTINPKEAKVRPNSETVEIHVRLDRLDLTCYMLTFLEVHLEK